MRFLIVCFAYIVLAISLRSTNAAEPIASRKGKLSDDKSTRWFDLQVLNIEGKAFRETKAPFDRLPAKAEG